MSAVDVLAVMDADARAVACVIDECRSLAREASWRAHLAEHDKARAVVVDLLLLTERVARLNRDAGEIGAGKLTQLVDEARAALARVQGDIA